MSIDDLAKRMHRDRTLVYRLESEDQEPRVDYINALVSILPISAEDLLIAMGVNLNPPRAAMLPRRLVDALLRLSPERLEALTELLASERP